MDLKTKTMYGIKFLRGYLAGMCMPLQEGETTIGRSDRNDLVIQDLMVSREHASFSLLGPALWIQDKRSTKGTYVNLRPVDRPARLYPGDIIHLGNQELEVVTREDPTTWVSNAGPAT